MITTKLVEAEDPQLEDDIHIVYRDGVEIGHVQICGRRLYGPAIESGEGDDYGILFLPEVSSLKLAIAAIVAHISKK